MLSGALSSSPSAGWCSICLIQRTFNTRVHPPASPHVRRTFGNGDLSDNLDAATPFRWTFDQDALTLSSLSEMFATVVICLFWVRDSFCVVCRFWLPCHISKTSWTLAFLQSVLSSSSLFNSKLLSVSDLSNAGSSPANIRKLTRPYFLATTCSWSVMHVVFDCLQPLTSRQRENWPPLRHHVVWLWTCRVPHGRDWGILSAFPLAHPTIL